MGLGYSLTVALVYLYGGLHKCQVDWMAGSFGREFASESEGADADDGREQGTHCGTSSRATSIDITSWSR